MFPESVRKARYTGFITIQTDVVPGPLEFAPFWVFFLRNRAVPHGITYVKRIPGPAEVALILL
jgi:hypothetical protein